MFSHDGIRYNRLIAKAVLPLFPFYQLAGLNIGAGLLLKRIDSTQIKQLGQFVQRGTNFI